jgi:anti-anti-sigma factor
MHEQSEVLRVSVRCNGRTLCLTVAGEIDMASAASLRTALDGALQAGVGDVDVDLADTTFCDSVGLCVLLSAHRLLGHAGRVLRLVDPAPCIVRLLDLSVAGGTFEVRDVPSSSADP